MTGDDGMVPTDQLIMASRSCSCAATEMNLDVN